MLTADGQPITLNDALGIPDLIDQTRYLLMLGQIPGSGDTKHLSIKAFSVSMPGVSNEAFEGTMGGHTMNFRGRRRYNTQLSVSFYEDSKMQTLKALRTWKENIVGTQSGNSQGYIDTYAVTAQLLVFDTTGKRIAAHTLHRLYIEDVPDVSLSAESSQAVQVQTQFRFTYFEADTHPML